MICNGCGFDRPMVDDHPHVGLDLCGPCVDWLRMVGDTDKGAAASIVKAYLSRKATHAQRNGETT